MRISCWSSDVFSSDLWTEQVSISSGTPDQVRGDEGGDGEFWVETGHSSRRLCEPRIPAFTVDPSLVENPLASVGGGSIVGGDISRSANGGNHADIQAVGLAGSARAGAGECAASRCGGETRGSLHRGPGALRDCRTGDRYL